MKTAKFQYKCRLCGETYNDACTHEDNAQMVLICTVLGQKMPSRLHGDQPDLISIHSSCKAGHGISDLIGYVVVDD